MAKGRRRGCPVNVKDWLIQAKYAGEADTAFRRVYGLTSITVSISADTEDGSTSADAWSEPYISKRSGSLSLEGRVVASADTGEVDPGQSVLNQAAKAVGCDGDITLRLTDPYGHASQANYIVTGRDESVTDGEATVSWDLEQVGEAESIAYVPVTGVEITSLGAIVTELEMDIADAARLCAVNVLPEDASNRRYRLSVSRRSVIHVGNVGEDSFTVAPLKLGTSVIRATAVNGGEQAVLTVNVVHKARPYETGVLGTGMLGLMVLGRSEYDIDDN